MGNFTGVIINKVNGGVEVENEISDRLKLLVGAGTERGTIEY